MTVQQQRDHHAREVVAALTGDQATPRQALTLLEDTCNDPESLHFAPHLIGALREANWWPDLMRAEADRRREGP